MKVLDVTLVDAVQKFVGERIRQIEEENFTYENDDKYKNGELAQAAAAYAAHASLCETVRQFASVPPMWPVSWDRSWWKPTTPERDLAKAGALIVAELQRLDRKAKKEV